MDLACRTVARDILIGTEEVYQGIKLFLGQLLLKPASCWLLVFQKDVLVIALSTRPGFFDQRSVD